MFHAQATDSAPERTHTEPGMQGSPQVVERRRHRRFKVGNGLVRVRCKTFEPDGAFVRIERRKLLGIVPVGGAIFEELCDLSRGGLSFEAPQRFSVGDRVRLSLFIQSWDEPMDLVGEVRWVRPAYGGSLNRVGIQFAPFGEQQPNPPEALAALKQLEAECTPGGTSRGEA